MKRRERRRARVRRWTGRGELGELGENRNCMFCLAEVRAVEERMFARASVLASEVEEGISISRGPLEGDMIVFGLV